MNPLLIRPQALEKATDPDQLDQALQIVRPRHVIALLLTAGVMLAALIWSVFATAPVYVSGQGLLRSAHDVIQLTTYESGYVEEVLLQPGAQVRKGQIIAYLNLPQRAEAVKVVEQAAAEAALAVQQLQEKAVWQAAQQEPFNQALRRSLEQGMAAQQKQLDQINQQAAITANQSDAESLQLQILQAELHRDINTARTELLRMEKERQHVNFMSQQALLQAQNKAESLQQQFANRQAALQQHRQLIAPEAGLLDELEVAVNDLVTPGQTIARLVMGDHSHDAMHETADQGEHDRTQASVEPKSVRVHQLNAVVFVPVVQGQKLSEGMEARIALASVKTDVYGYLQGKVQRVAELPASRTGLLRRLQNEVLVEQILQAGAAVEVEVALKNDSTTPSGYAWTSGQGPDMHIETGTLAGAEITVERSPVISLIFPAAGVAANPMGGS